MKRIVSIVSLLVVLVFAFAGCGSKEPPAEEEQLVPVETITVSKTDLAHILNTTGEVIAKQEVNVMPKVSGRVQQVLVNVGDTVRKGQVLFQLEQNDAGNALEQAGAGLELAQANLERSQQVLKDAQTNYNRTKSLFEAQAISEAQFESAESSVVSAQTSIKVSEAQLRQAQAGLQAAQDNYQNTTIVSPIDGEVAKVDVNPGEMVNPQFSPVTIVQISTTKVKVNVSENVVGNIKTGTQAPVTINAINKTVKGTVISVAPQADKSTRAFAVEIQLPNENGEIKPGMVARLNISTGTSAGILALPVNAVLEQDGQHYVFVLQDGIAKQVSVQVGIASGELIEIKSGLEENQTVIATGNKLVSEGQKVKVVKELGGAAR
ncbi:MAG: efflux RND transporter periplasmic adaptor subunit [Desulfotomaculaceae bacterium]|nr:efflux RND transporter periplasmic adaptor subunit [Desulfotomaculaceae bacterium]